MSTQQRAVTSRRRACWHRMICHSGAITRGQLERTAESHTPGAKTVLAIITQLTLVCSHEFGSGPSWQEQAS